jgi:hypothetical protein
MKTQYKLLKDLPAVSAGTIIERESSYADKYPDFFQPLPQPKEEKTEYTLDFYIDRDFPLLSKEIDLTEPAAQAVAEAIQHMLEVVNESYEKDHRGGVDKYAFFLKKLAEARAAVQKDKS